MKKLCSLLTLFSLLLTSGCFENTLLSNAPSDAASAEAPQESAPAEKLRITANGETLTAVFENNASADAFRVLLRSGDITIDMTDYNQFEKVGSLDAEFPRSDTQITTVPGDVILYQGHSITIYYGSNTWNFTRLARIENAEKENLLQILGSGDVTVTFSIQGD